MVKGSSRVTVMEVTEGLNGNQPLEMGPENSGFPCPANLPLPACQILTAKKKSHDDQSPFLVTSCFHLDSQN